MGRRSDIKPLPSLERLNELLRYEPKTGVLLWNELPATTRQNIGFNNKCADKIAGTIGASGYLVIGISKKYYLAHRIIWKMMTGTDPVDIIDHEDTDRSNNRWVNLREAANGSNIQNSCLRKDNKSGIKGVHWVGGRSAWRGVITVGGKQVQIGRFRSLETAKAKVEAERLRLHGEYARLG